MNRRLLMKVFLGGTCSGSKWREKIIPKLKRTNIDYYNPVVPVWDKEAKQRERREKQEADYCIYVLTPLMYGFYSIAEVVDDSNKKPEKTILCILDEDDGNFWTGNQLSSLNELKKLVSSNGTIVVSSLSALLSCLYKYALLKK